MHPHAERRASPARYAASPAGYAASPAGDAAVSPKSRICDTAEHSILESEPWETSKNIRIFLYGIFEGI